ncbi:MAG: AAA family ATPase [Motilibacteraceae bacterium]
MTVLLEPDTGAAEALAFALGGEMTRVDTPHALTRVLDDNPLELLVVVGADVDLAVALQVATGYRTARPELGVVLLRRRVDVAVLGQALRSGVREVVNPDDLTALADACRRSVDVSRRLLGSTAAQSHAAEGRVVTVFSAKGGCGKTTLATNLAVALADGGRCRVCVVDLDLAFGDVAIAMQLVPARTIVDAVAMQGSMDAQGVSSLVTPHSPGLDTVLAPLEPGEAERIPVSVVTELLRVLRTMYDFVVIDSPPAFTDHVLAAFDLADTYVLLATLDIPALKNLRLTLDMLDLLGYPRESWQVVLNRSDSKVGLAVADVEKTLKVPIAVQVPSSRAVSASINKGVPIVLDEPNHPVSQAIRALAEQRVRGTSSGGVATLPAGARRRSSTVQGKESEKERRGFAFLRRGSVA